MSCMEVSPEGKNGQAQKGVMPAKAGIQYPEWVRLETVWRSGILDRPLSQTMTAGIAAILAIKPARPYSAGFSAGGGVPSGGGAALPADLAAVFSTMETATIEPS